ncbi:MAG: DNA replication and repair protein RecF [Candidatus Rhabdochlamydia sp.]
MFIRKIYLRHFRNYEEEVITFSPHTNLIWGNNAQGKTSLLEAIFLASMGRSFRTPHLKDLIRDESSFFFIEIQFEKDNISQVMKLSFDGVQKRLEINNSSYTYFNPVLGILPIVLLAPEDVQIICGSPADRRRFLDLHLAQKDPLYVFHLTRYHRALKHRNTLLKQGKTEGLFPFEQLMLTAASYLQEKREEFLNDLAPLLQSSIQALSHHQDYTELCYRPSQVKDYTKYQARDLHLKSTSLGPHRDDFTLLINQKPAIAFASQGQIRSAVASLRLAEWKLLSSYHQLPALFCIDDFGVHLDQQRREALLSHLTSSGQIFLTSPFFLEQQGYHSLPIHEGKLSLLF